jgi:hypothetical protein
MEQQEQHVDPAASCRVPEFARRMRGNVELIKDGVSVE